MRCDTFSLAAARVIDAIREQNLLLAKQSMIGRHGRVEGTREWINSRFPYITVYRVRESLVEVIAVVHTSRRWPSGFSG